jgi:DNA-binding CsgD family transcriptional regulator
MRDANPDKLQRAYSDLGEAAIDPSIWPRAMERICDAVAATGALLLQSDVRTSDVPRTQSIEELVRSYFDHGWHTRDTRAARGVPLLLNGRRVITDADIMTYDELRTLPDYNEHFTPLGFRWFAAIGFYAGPALWGMSIQRTIGQGPFEAADVRLLTTLSGRLTEAATLSTAVGRIALTSATNALNAVAQPAIALDRFGLVLDANAAAENLFDEHIRVNGRRLVVEDRQARGRLEALSEQLRATADTATLPCDPIVIRRGGKSPVIGRILGVHGAARTPFLGARALLTLTAVEARPGPSRELLCRTFGLTPAEARLAAIIAQGRAPEVAAEELGVSKVTVRNQLRAVFAKTDTHRQSELVALLSALR